ncbi:MAG: HEAT repeat domain-containing protein, partial [Pirellulales bacterium]
RLHGLTLDKQDYIVDIQNCIVGSGAVERWKASLKKHCQADKYPDVAVGKLSDGYKWVRAPNLVRARWTEAQATIAHLERQPGGGKALAKCLAHNRPEIRAAAAAALGAHLDEDGVAEALAAAFDDTHAEVRGAAVQAIAYAKKPPPERAVQDGSAVEAAVLRAIDSPDDSMRYAAMQATRWFPGKRAEQALRDLAEASPVESLASDLLAKRTSKVVGEESRGAGSPPSIDDVLAKLDEAQVSTETFKEAGKLSDPRIIAKLISLAQLTDVGMLRHRVDQGAVVDALVNLRATEAVEPLAALLRQSWQHRNEHTILNAFVRLGDPRASEFIKQALRDAEPEWRFRLKYYLALAQLGDRQAYEMLANLLKEPLPQIETRQLLWSLVKSDRNELVALVEPLLDDEDFCSETADCLARNGGSQGLEMLKRRLTKEDDPLVAALFQGLQRDPEWHASPTGQGLLGDVARNGSAEAKRFAEDLLSEE